MSRFLIDRTFMSYLWFICLVLPLISCTQENRSVRLTEPTAKLEIADPEQSLTFEHAELLGQFEPSIHPQFVEVPTDLCSRAGMFLRTETVEAFKKMASKAKEDGVSLKIISATRNFDRQKVIWEGKWNGTRKQNGRNLRAQFIDQKERALEILKYSSMPGTSRHHWGTDIDINSLNNSNFESGKGKKEYEWLRDNGFEFGFCQVYSAKDDLRPEGYEEEKWHWSYVPLSTEMHQAFVAQIDSTEFGGFEGDKALSFAEVIKYVNGIAPECK